MDFKVAAASTVMGTAAYLLGWNGAVEALCICMVVDYISGVLAAYVNPNLALNSNIGFRGICKKLLILCVLVVTQTISARTEQEFVHTIAVWFFLANEALSVLENAGKAGVPIPDALRNSLEQLKGMQERKGDKK